MADTSVVDLNADFVGLWGRNLDILDGEVFASLPRNGGLLFMLSAVFSVVVSSLLVCLGWGFNRSTVQRHEGSISTR